MCASLFPHPLSSILRPYIGTVCTNNSEYSMCNTGSVGGISFNIVVIEKKAAFVRESYSIEQNQVHRFTGKKVERPAQRFDMPARDKLVGRRDQGTPSL